ncbi:MAG: hypothetical protein R3E56_21480 [Burkholderiaceae bacterium]
MQHAVLQQLASSIHQWLQPHAAGAHPLGEWSVDGETSSTKDRPAVQRQVVGVLATSTRQQPGGGDAFVDDVRIDGNL